MPPSVVMMVSSLTTAASRLACTAISAHNALGASGGGYMVRMCIYWIAVSTIGAAWALAAGRRTRPGWQRAMLLAPLVAVQLAATPFLVDAQRTPALVVLVMGMMSLSAFKILAFSCGRGPLALQGTSLLALPSQFAAVMALPVIPCAAFNTSHARVLRRLPHRLAPRTAAEFACAYARQAGAAAVAAAAATLPGLPVLLVHWLYALILSLTLGAVWDGWAWVAAMLGLSVAPGFDAPWLSASFGEYWARRWNLTTTYMLRVLVYEPIMEGRIVPLMVAAAATERPGSTAGEDPALALSNNTKTLNQHDCRDTNSCNGEVVAEQAEGGTNRPSEPAAAPAGDPHHTEGCTDKMTRAGSATPHHSKHSMTGSDGKNLSAANDTGCCYGSRDGDNIPCSSAADNGACKYVRPTAPPSQLRRLLALQATFAFSGAWHVLIFYYATGLVSWHWFAFFSLQAPILVAESAVQRLAALHGFALCRPLAVLLTNLMLIVVARPLFFGPCDWSGLCNAMFSTTRAALGLLPG